MDSQQVINVIQSVGFPIVMCGAMGWFVYHMYNKNTEMIKELTETHDKEVRELQNAIDNNTIALTKVIDVINGIEKN